MARWGRGAQVTTRTYIDTPRASLYTAAMRIAPVLALAVACVAPTSSADEALPPDCTPRAEYTYLAGASVTRVYLLADGFEADGCTYRGEVVLRHERGYLWSYGNVGLSFDANGRVLACDYPRLCVFEPRWAVPVGDCTSTDARDVRGFAMPAGACGVAP